MTSWVGKDPEEILDALLLANDPGMHHEAELGRFYERLENSGPHQVS